MRKAMWGGVASSIDTATCGDELITNRAGMLACKQSHQPGLPQGSYRVLRGCLLQAGTLACTACRNAAGGEAASELRDATACASIGNADGHLECQDNERRRLERDHRQSQPAALPTAEHEEVQAAAIDGEARSIVASLKDEI